MKDKKEDRLRKWHIMVIIYLITTIAYIIYMAMVYNIWMIGFLIATVCLLAVGICDIILR